MSSPRTYRSLPLGGLGSKAIPGAAERRPLREFVGLLVIIPALAGFVVLGFFVKGANDLTRLDTAVHTSLGEWSGQTPGLTAACRFLTALGDAKTLAVIGLLVAAGLLCLGVKYRRYFRELVIWVIGLVGAGLLNFALKHVIQRPRPDQELALAPADGWSFPSGHALGSLVLFGMAAYLLTRVVSRRSAYLAVGTVLAMAVLGIGFSRVYLGAHWLSDVLGSYLAGACWLAVCLTAFIVVRPGAKDGVRRDLPTNPVKMLLPPVTAAGRRKKPWRRARKAEGGRLTSEADSEPHVAPVLS